MEKSFLQEAFTQLKALNEEDYQVFNDEDMEDLKDLLDDENGKINLEADVIEVIDPEAPDEDSLKDSYIGKVICECPVCHSKIYKDAEDIVIGESNLVDEGEECPYCYSVDGFTIIGQVAPYVQETEEKVEEPEEETEEVKEEETEEVLEESSNWDKIKAYAKKHGMNLDAGNVEAGIKRFNTSANLGEGCDSINESYVEEWWGQSDEDPEDFAKKYHLTAIALENNGDETLWRFEGSKEDVEKAIGDGYFYSLSLGEAHAFSDDLMESFEHVKVETNNEVLDMNAEEDGKVTITTEPKCDDCEECEECEEVVAPISDETEEEIVSENEEEVAEEEPSEKPEEEEEFVDVDFNYFDEEGFDELGESYLKNIYENVNTFRTTKVSIVNEDLIVEGNIKFSSGKEKPTSFRFSPSEITKRGFIRFVGENMQITPNKNAFILKGRKDGAKLVCESLNYRYSVKADDGKAQRVYGTVNAKK